MSRLESPAINMACMFVSLARPIEFSIAISMSLEELGLRKNVPIKSFLWSTNISTKVHFVFCSSISILGFGYSSLSTKTHTLQW